MCFSKHISSLNSQRNSHNNFFFFFLWHSGILIQPLKEIADEFIWGFFRFSVAFRMKMLKLFHTLEFVVFSLEQIC